MKSKRFLSFVLALVMVLALLPASALAGYAPSTAAVQNWVAEITGRTMADTCFINYKQELRITVYPATMTANINFSYTEVTPAEDLESSKDKDNDRYSKIMSFVSQLESATGSGTASVETTSSSSYKLCFDYISFPVIPQEDLSESYWPAGEIKNVNWKQWDQTGLNRIIVGTKRSGTGSSGNSASAYVSRYWEGDEQPQPQKPEEPRKFTIGRDNFSFVNINGAFFGSASAKPGIEPQTTYAAGTYGSLYDPDTIRQIAAGLGESKAALMHEKLSKPFNGLCRGMTTVAGLLYTGKYSHSDFGSVTQTYDYPLPKNNKALLQAIAYYHLMQYSDFELAELETNQLEQFLYGNHISTLISLAEKLLPDTPISIPLISKHHANDEKMFGHSMLVFDMEKTGGSVKFSAYDPNYPTETIYLTPNAANTALTASNHYSEPIYISYPMAVDALYESDYTTFPIEAIVPDVSGNEAYVEATGDNITVTCGDESAVIRNGEKVSGNLNITFVPGEQTDAPTHEVMFFMNPIRPSYRIEIDDPDSDSYVTIWTKNIQAYADGGKGDMTIYASDGSVVAEFENSSKENRLSVVSPGSGGGLAGTTVRAKTSGVTVTPTSSGAKVRTSDGAKATVSASGKTESIKFENVDTSKEVQLETKNRAVSLSSDGKQIAKGTASASGATGAAVTEKTGDVQQIAKEADSKAGQLSDRIVEKIKKSDDTVKSFRSHGYNYDSWAEEELARADAFGLIPASVSRKFKRAITRKEFTELVYAIVKSVTGMTDEEMAAYADTPDSSNPYSYEYEDPSVAFAYGCGIVNGYPDGSFQQDNSITRSEAAKMLVTTAELLGKTTSERGAKYFNDSPYDWSQTYINKISSIVSSYSGTGVMQGDTNGNFMPKGTYTAEQAVLTMERLLESVVGESAGYSGGVVKKETPASADGDLTGFVPVFSWERVGTEGYGRKIFTSGKYVREDGRAVLYVDSSDTLDAIAYQIYVLPEGAKQSAYETSKAYNAWDSSPFAWMEPFTATLYLDSYAGLSFYDLENAGLDAIRIESDWIDEMYYAYPAPDGDYYLVREL